MGAGARTCKRRSAFGWLSSEMRIVYAPGRSSGRSMFAISGISISATLGGGAATSNSPTDDHNSTPDGLSQCNDTVCVPRLHPAPLNSHKARTAVAVGVWERNARRRRKLSGLMRQVAGRKHKKVDVCQAKYAPTA